MIRRSFLTLAASSVALAACGPRKKMVDQAKIDAGKDRKSVV